MLNIVSPLKNSNECLSTALQYRYSIHNDISTIKLFYPPTFHHDIVNGGNVRLCVSPSCRKSQRRVSTYSLSQLHRSRNTWRWPAALLSRPFCMNPEVLFWGFPGKTRHKVVEGGNVLTFRFNRGHGLLFKVLPLHIRSCKYRQH